jgi:hypothetical protein
LKENASRDELEKYAFTIPFLHRMIPMLTGTTRAKETAKSQGGEIKHEFTLISGFT